MGQMLGRETDRQTHPDFGLQKRGKGGLKHHGSLAWLGRVKCLGHFYWWN